jgi:hypothetical protein
VKQLTILCSSDLSEEVRGALVAAGAEGFLQLPGAVGNKPGAAAEHGRYPRWEAEMFLAPATPEVVQKAVARLRSLADNCDVEPCLRILVSTLDEVY